MDALFPGAFAAKHKTLSLPRTLPGLIWLKNALAATRVRESDRRGEVQS
ncbi:hypothetical protein [Metallibacterium sp.]|jgi:hypothetical protein|nr:hypothetical protein [Metallibacterium sp.]